MHLCEPNLAAQLTSRISYYHGSGREVRLWCPEDIYIEEAVNWRERIWRPASRDRGFVLDNEAAMGALVVNGCRLALSRSVVRSAGRGVGRGHGHGRQCARLERQTARR